MARAHCAIVAFDPTTSTVLTSATVNVYTPGTVTPIGVTMFDKNGNTLSNPLTSDATTGLVDFYLGVAQEVDLVVSKASFTTRTYSNVPVLDDASNNLTALLTTIGDIVYASSNNTPARLGITGVTGAPLVMNGGLPHWVATSSDDIVGARIRSSLGTAAVDAKFSISAGWGSTATCTAQSFSNDQHGQFVIVCGGTGIAANPTVTFTYSDAAWAHAPHFLCQIVGGTGAGSAFAINANPGTTSVQFQMFFTPTTGQNYFFTYMAMGV